MNEVDKVAPQASEPYAVLVFERGEEGPFDRKPVKPDSVQHLHAKRDPHYDYIELYTHPTQQGLDADTLLRVIQRLNQNPYSLTKSECVSEVHAMRDAAIAAQAKQGGA